MNADTSRRLFVRAYGPTGMRWDEPTAADIAAYILEHPALLQGILEHIGDIPDPLAAVEIADPPVGMRQ